MNLLRSFTLGLTSFPFAIFLATNPVLTDVPSVEAQPPPDLTYQTQAESYAPVYDPAYDPNYDPAQNQAYAPAYDPSYAPAHHPNYNPNYDPNYTPAQNQQEWSSGATYDPNYSGEIQDRTSDITYPVGVEVFTHLSERNFILRKILQSIVTYFARNVAWTGVLAAVGAAERVFPQITEFTFLEEEDHGTGADAAHALAEVVTTIGHGGFEMLLWGMAGFVNPVKSGKLFEQALGIQVEDEFFKDNAIESGGTLMFWAVMGFFYFLLNIL